LTFKGVSIIQLRIIVLNIFGIALVTLGFILMFPLQGAPTQAVYLMPSNADAAAATILIGIIILMVALIESIKH
jgi:hypothetical protein